MGARYGSHFVRHGGDRGASLVDGSKTDFFDEHPGQDPGQSKRVVNIRHHRIWRIVFGCQFGNTCALHIEFPCLDGRTQRSFSTGCMCPLVIPFVCTLSSFVLAGFDTSLDRRAGWANQSISYCKRRFFGRGTHSPGRDHVPSGGSPGARLAAGPINSYTVSLAELCARCSCLMMFSYG